MNLSEKKMIKKNFYKTELYQHLPAILFMAGIFFLVSYLTQRNAEAIEGLVSDGGVLSIFVYIAITIIAIVAAPLTSLPLMPLAVQGWGVFLAAIFSIIGWTIGSLGAFWVARTFGITIVSKMQSLARIRAVANRVPEEKMFWYLLFLRMTIPVDVLSYALGLFTNISWKMFLVTTFIGVIPATILFAYVGSLPVKWQLFFALIGLAIIIAFFSFHLRKSHRAKKLD